MTEYCAGCGEPVGHADEIVAEYEEHGIKTSDSADSIDKNGD